MHVEVLLAADVHDVQAHDVAGHARERDVEVDPHRLPAAGVHRELVVRAHGEVGAELGDEEHQHHRGRHERDHTARQSALEEVLVHLGEGVEALQRLHEGRTASGVAGASPSAHRSLGVARRGVIEPTKGLEGNPLVVRLAGSDRVLFGREILIGIFDRWFYHSSVKRDETLART